MYSGSVQACVTVVSCAQSESPVNNVRESVQVRTAGPSEGLAGHVRSQLHAVEHARATTEFGS